MIKYFLYSMTVVVGLSVGLLITTDQSYAVSVYDDMNISDELMIRGKNISTDYMALIEDWDNDHGTDYVDQILVTVQNSDCYSISTVNSYQTRLMISYGIGNNCKFVWDQATSSINQLIPVMDSRTETGYYMFDFVPDGETVKVSSALKSSTAGSSCGSITNYVNLTYCPNVNDMNSYLSDNAPLDAGGRVLFLAFGFDPNYPTGYEGNQINSSYTAPIDMGYIPKIFIEDITNWHMTLRDENFNTFDPVPFTCREDLTPIMYYEITTPDDSGILIDGSISPTIKLEVDLQDPDTADKTLKNWHISAWYDCFNDGITFEDKAEVDFYTTGYGNIDRRIYEKCITEEAPWIDFQACYNNIGTFIDTFIFDKIPMPNWDYNTNCHELGKMGDWLNLKPSQRVVCQEMPEDVVNTVTPFISVFLGLTTLTILLYAINKRDD